MNRHIANRLLRRIPPLVALGALVFSLALNRWSWFHIPPVYEEDDMTAATYALSFGDIRSLTAAAECINEGTWDSMVFSCDLFGRPFNYPDIWAQVFAHLGLGDSYAAPLGLALGGLVLMSFAIPLIYIARSQRSLGHLVALSLCVASPPVALQLNRGNTDGLILAIVGISSLLYQRKRSVSAALMGTVTALKFFPVVALAAFEPIKRRFLAPVSFLATACIILYPSADSLVRLAEMQNPPGAYSFGSSLFLYHFLPVGLNFPRLWILMGGFASTIAASLAAWLLCRSRLGAVSTAIRSNPLGHATFTINGMVFVGSFLSGARYDYSQIFLVMTLIGLSLTPATGLFVKALVGMGLTSLWGAFYVSQVSMVADVSTGVFVWILLSVLFQDRIDVFREIMAARTD